jgi:hypothetical protein
MPLQRPCVDYPLQFAPSERIDAYPELAEDFRRRIFDGETTWAWISDETRLDEFHDGETDEPIVARIKEVYGVDVSDISSGCICEILERIAATRRVSGG